MNEKPIEKPDNIACGICLKAFTAEERSAAEDHKAIVHGQLVHIGCFEDYDVLRGTARRTQHVSCWSDFGDPNEQRSLDCVDCD